MAAIKLSSTVTQTRVLWPDLNRLVLEHVYSNAAICNRQEFCFPHLSRFVPEHDVFKRSVFPSVCGVRVHLRHTTHQGRHATRDLVSPVAHVKVSTLQNVEISSEGTCENNFQLADLTGSFMFDSARLVKSKIRPNEPDTNS